MEINDDLLSLLIKDSKYYYENNDTYGFNYFKFNKESNYPLLCLNKSNKSFSNYLVKINKDKFIELVKLIDEFKIGEEEINEINLINDHEGKFYKLVIDNKIQGVVCVEMEFDDYIYVSYLGVFKEYRKTLASTKLIDSLKLFKKNILLSIINPHLLSFYLNKGFEVVDIFYFG